MKIFAKTNIWKKIVIIFTILTSLSFAAPKPVEASIGGTLMKPICQFLVAIGDGVMGIIHKGLIQEDVTIISVDLSNGGILGFIKKVIIPILICVGVAAAIALSGGIVGAIGAAHAAIVGAVGGLATVNAIAVVGGIVLKATVGAIVTGVILSNVSLFSDEIDIPLYRITPEEIFSNNDKFPIFNVNFINPPDETYVSTWSVEANIEDRIDNVSNKAVSNLSYDTISGNGWMPDSSQDVNENTMIKWLGTTKTPQGKTYAEQYGFTNADAIQGQAVKNNLDKVVIKSSEGDPSQWYVVFNDYIYCLEGKKETITIAINGDKQEIWKYRLSRATNPGYITKDGKIDKSSEAYKKAISGGEAVQGQNTETISQDMTTEIHTISYDLSKFISNTYKRLRMIALVGMMSVLVYIGIRILISSTSSQKAKYKQLIGDWFVGMILLFTMHFIMSFANLFVDEISKFLNNNNPSLYTIIIGSDDEEDLTKIEDGLEKYGYSVTTDQNNVSDRTLYKDEYGIYWHTNLMGAVRYYAKYNAYNDNTAFIGYTLMFLVLVIYTITFTFTYLKRIIYLAFLTLISPLVALTYPIDKVNDGSAQGFNYWFKEYIFNLLLQPLHLLIYTILVSSALEFATTNWIYSLVALGFVASAEKIVRQMFNFQKASTPGILAGPAGAAMTMTGMRWLLGHGPKGGKDGASGSKKANNSTDSEGVNITSTGEKTKYMDAFGDLMDEGKDADIPNKDDGGAGGVLPVKPISGQQSFGGTQEADDDYSEAMASYGGYDEYYPSNVRTANINPLNIDSSDKSDNVFSKKEDSPLSIQSFERNPIPKIDEKYLDKKYNQKAKRRAIKAGFKNAFSDYNAKQYSKAQERWKNARPGKALAKTLGGVTTGVAFGMAGLATGIASGDASKAFQYASAGAIGGAKMGSSGAGNIADKAQGNRKDMKESYERGYYGKDYRKHAGEKYAKEYAKRDEVVRQVYNDNPELSWKQAQEKAVQQALEYGAKENIYDAKEWAKLDKMKNKVAKRTKDGKEIKYGHDGAMGAYRIQKRFGDAKDKQEFMEKVKASDPNASPARVETYWRAMNEWNNVQNS